MSTSTSRWRGVRRPSAGAGSSPPEPTAAVPAPPPPPRATSVVTTWGLSSDCPAWTVRTASTTACGLASLRRNPEAPARSAPSTYSSTSNMVRTSTRVPASAESAQMRRVASMPESPGI